MKVTTLLAQARKCKTDKATAKLLARMEQVFSKSPDLGHLGLCNDEAFMEGDKPFVRFELNHVISKHHITMICPRICDDLFTVTVATHRMLDGMGMFSKSWETEADMEHILEAADGTIAEIAKRAKERAIANHAELLARLGVGPMDALVAAQKSW